ncbi:MAG: Glu-tRNA(Gln) amidotransferase subunit GatE, partial [Thermoprotei archaeon]
MKGKLFCNCPPQTGPADGAIRFVRFLRASRSELGEVDRAASFEEKRSRTYIYEASSANSCLVEMDEEPPHRINQQALEAALMVSQLLEANVVDEVQVMRKLVIDGSNTSGFQRTALVATGGKINVRGKVVGISTVCLEEDAARLVTNDRLKGEATYSLDRLGVPLIEISTMPDLESPEEVEAAAAEIGRILRRTRLTKRGLGTIRQDVNISVEGGSRVEIKGVQLLSLIPEIVKLEVARQNALVELGEYLRRTYGSFSAGDPVDVSQIFEHTECRLISGALSKGWKVFGAKVTGFSSVFGKVAGYKRFGAEVADYARQLGGVGGLLHSDELPAYGVTEDEVRAVRSMLGCLDKDGFVLVVGETRKAVDALGLVLERCRQAFEGPVPETRGALPDGTTRYLRPMPGAERMYPETDVPYVTVGADEIRRVNAKIPPP